MRKRWKIVLFSCVRIFLSVVYCVLPYLYIFVDVAVLPGYNEKGEPVRGRFTCSRSIFNRLQTLGCAWILIVHIALACVAILSAAFATVKWRKKGIRRFSWIVFGVSTAVFLSILLVGSRQYALY